MVMLYNKTGEIKTNLSKHEADELIAGDEWFESEKEAKEAYQLKLDAEKRDVERQKQEAEHEAQDQRNQIENNQGITARNASITKPTPTNTLGKEYDVNDHAAFPADYKAKAKPQNKHGNK